MSEKLPESPEAIAYLLMKDVLKIEGKCIEQLDKKLSHPLKHATREDILNTYCDCLALVNPSSHQVK